MKISEKLYNLRTAHGLSMVGTIPAEQLAEKADQLTRRKSALDAQIEKEHSSSTIQPEQALRLAQSFGDVLRSGNREEIRAVIVTLINKIALDDENVTIYWNF